MHFARVWQPDSKQEFSNFLWFHLAITSKTYSYGDIKNTGTGQVSKQLAS